MFRVRVRVLLGCVRVRVSIGKFVLFDRGEVAIGLGLGLGLEQLFFWSIDPGIELGLTVSVTSSRYRQTNSAQALK